MRYEKTDLANDRAIFADMGFDGVHDGRRG